MRANDEILLRMTEDGSFGIYEPYATVECETKEDYDRLFELVELGKSIVRCEDCDNWDKDHTFGSKRLGNLAAPCSEWSNLEDGYIRFTRWDCWCSEALRRENDETD